MEDSLSLLLSNAHATQRINSQIFSFDPSCTDPSSRGRPCDFASYAFRRLQDVSNGKLAVSADLAVLQLAIAPNAVKLSEEGIRVILVETMKMSPAVKSSTSRLRNKLKDRPLPTATLLSEIKALKPTFVKGLECRITGVCDFCDMAFVVSKHVSLSYDLGFKFFGAGFGHASVYNGITPHSHLDITHCVSRPYENGNFGIPHSQRIYEHKPEKSLSNHEVGQYVREVDHAQIMEALIPVQNPSPCYNPVSPDLVPVPSAPPIIDDEPVLEAIRPMPVIVRIKRKIPSPKIMESEVYMPSKTSVFTPLKRPSKIIPVRPSVKSRTSFHSAKRALFPSPSIKPKDLFFFTLVDEPTRP